MLNIIETLENQIKNKKIQLESIKEEAVKNVSSEFIKHIDISKLDELGLTFEIDDNLNIKATKGIGEYAAYIYQQLKHYDFQQKFTLSSNIEIKRFEPKFENEKDDIKLFKNYFFIKTTFESVKEWFDENIVKAVEELNKPIDLLLLEIESLKALLDLEQTKLFDTEVRKLYYEKDNEIEHPIILKRNWDSERYENENGDYVRVRTISYSKEFSTSSVKIKGEYDKGYKQKYICGIRNCESISRDRWECEYATLNYNYSNNKRVFTKKWENGIISDTELRDYCESVVKSKVDFNKNITEPTYDLSESFVPNPIELDVKYYTSDYKLLTKEELDCIINGEFEIDENGEMHLN
jgi:hypothetical protein